MISLGLGEMGVNKLLDKDGDDGLDDAVDDDDDKDGVDN